MNSKFTLWLVFAVAFFLPHVVHAQRKPRIIVVTHGQASDPFWLIVRNGVESASKETDSDVDYRSPEKFDVQAMAQLVDEAVASKPDGLVVVPADGTRLVPGVQATFSAVADDATTGLHLRSTNFQEVIQLIAGLRLGSTGAPYFAVDIDQANFACRFFSRASTHPDCTINQRQFTIFLEKTAQARFSRY